MSRGQAALAGALAPFVASALAAGPGCGGETKSHDRIVRSNRDAAAVVVVDRPTGAGTGGGPAIDLPAEREPNAKPADAGAIGDGVQGVLDGDADVDAFVIASPGPRMLTAALSPLPGIDLKLELRDKDFAPILASDRGGDGVGEGLADAPLDKGTYYLVVREIAKPPPKKPVRPKPGAPPPPPAGRIGRSPPYTLTAALVTDPAAGAEREPDDDAGAANDVSLIEPVTGRLGWNGDVDVWKLSLEGLTDGNGLDLTVSAVPGVTLGLAVTDAADRPRVAAAGLPGQPLTLRSVAPKLAPGEAPVHYVKISGRPPNPDVAYTLAITARLLDLDEESEPNDRPQLATPLRYGAEEDGTMRGLLAAGEVDVYSLSSSSGLRQLDAAIGGLAGLDLVCEVLSASASALDKVDRGGVGAGEDCTGAIAAGTDAYVRITAKASKKPQAPAAYTLRWSSAAGGPSMAPPDDPLPPEE
jgi:hypothetical protein